MGVFSEGAIRIKRAKKIAFLKLFKLFGTFKNIIWSFTSEDEKDEASSILKGNTINNYIIAEDLPRKINFSESINYANNYIKEKNNLRIIFLSRICEKKNLLYCLDILKHSFNGEISLNIIGIKEDNNYWEKCEEKIKEFPDNIHVQYCGEVKPQNVIETFRKYDIFLFPTRGENFGHVIYEALASGCIPVISDTTPWRDLDIKECGSVVKLDNTKEFRDAIVKYMSMNSDEIRKIRVNAASFAERKYNDSVNSSGYNTVFEICDGN